MSAETPKLDSYSSLERRFLAPYRQIALTVVHPIVWVLARLGIRPNWVSISQVAVGGIVLLVIGSQPRLAFVLFLLALLIDGLDGALARYTGRSSRYGALVDQVSDHARETLVIAALASTGGLSAVLATLYAFVYVAFNFILFLCNYFRVPVQVALKTYLFTYPAIFCYLWLGWNWLDIGVGIAVAVMSVVIVLGLWRLRNVVV
jgi:CDP-diacylglycerol--glycerol-3-phosphate 3-phosphatidyltransferase